MLSRSRSVSGPRWSPAGDRLAWIESFDGRADVVVGSVDPGGELSGPSVVVTAECGVGGGFDWADDDVLVVAAADGRLALVHAGGGVERFLTRDGHAIAPVVSARGEVACAIERDDACDIATLPLDGSAWPERVSLADYAWDPEWSPDGGALVWQEWDLPNMPWHASRLVRRDAPGEKSSVFAAEGACSQPRFSPDGSRLAWVSDGRLIVDGEAIDGQQEHECAEPAWSPRQRSFAWSPASDELAWCRNESGFGRMVIGAPGRKSARELSRGWHREIGWGERGIVCVRSGAVTPPQVVVLAPNGSARRAIARGPVGGFERTRLVEPRPVTWKAGSAVVHGLLWRAPEARGASSLVVHVHGGPTGQALADWNPRVQWLVQQGYAVLQPNHRGSSGYGVAYRNALDGQWGEVDTADVAAGIKHALKEGWAAPDRIALMGSSAGGFTVLNVAARHPELVTAVVAVYPVTDLLDLAATTHRFESGDLTRLVGPLPEARAEYVARSPLTRASDVRAPVLLLQGDQDRVVNPERAATFADALRRAGVAVDLHVYAGEGHGWRRAETVADELARISSFLSRWV
ncbi:MAG: dipeptidyl aminopeptidase/acylaminoacyl peptidase [Actinomycetia bacterium]|nr:dipeptidyl aminopeptidase/acylaminoacyl peptidase [Actinomycetes bacterium]